MQTTAQWGVITTPHGRIQADELHRISTHKRCKRGVRICLPLHARLMRHVFLCRQLCPRAGSMAQQIKLVASAFNRRQDWVKVSAVICSTFATACERHDFLQDDLLDCIYWLRQIIGIAVALVFGVMAFTGFQFILL